MRRGISVLKTFDFATVLKLLTVKTNQTRAFRSVITRFAHPAVRTIRIVRKRVTKIHRIVFTNDTTAGTCDHGSCYSVESSPCHSNRERPSAESRRYGGTTGRSDRTAMKNYGPRRKYVL